jgi:hypothetical protein
MPLPMQTWARAAGAPRRVREGDPLVTRPGDAPEALLTGSAPASEPLPTAWCRTILTALEQQGAADREAGHLEMLLCSFIEMQVAPADFGRLLARYAADPRPGSAEAAGMLQCAWDRATTATAPMPLPEQLGLLGRPLHRAGALAAYLSVGPAGASIQGCGPTPYERTLRPLELQQEHARRSAGSGAATGAAPAGPDRFETRPYVFGVLLAGQPAQTYKLFVGPHCVEVESSDGSCQMFPSGETVASGSGVGPGDWALGYGRGAWPER